MSKTTQTKKNSIQIKDCFLRYPYKKPGASVYISKSNDDKHPYAVSCTEYTTIIKCFAKNLIEEMFKGKTIRLGFNLGEVYMKAYQSRSLRDKFSSLESKTKLFRNNLDNHMLNLCWTNKHLHHSYMWELKPNRAMIKELYAKCEKDIKLIYNLVR